MKYIFGKVIIDEQEYKNVKTVGDEHSDLKGYCHVERQDSDSIVIDDFRIVKKYKSDETVEACYDWYIISEHSRYVDRFSQAETRITSNIDDTQDAVCILSEDIETRIADVEDALCSLTS